MRIIIDTEKCEGSARCYNLYTDIFVEGDDAKGVVRIEGEIEDELMIIEAQSAANACPRGAITLEY